METLEFLLKHVLRIILVLAVAWIMLWFLNLVYPGFKISELFSTKLFSSDWLPAPKNYGSVFKPQTGGVYGQVFQVPANYPPSNVDFIVYTATGTQIIKAAGSQDAQNQVFNGTTANYADKARYLRNLSLYDGWNISYGSDYIGEANEIMFRNGSFPIFILDSQNRLIATTQAMNTGTWAAPGWARFKFTIPVRLPSQALCTLVFMSAQNSQIQVRMNVRCN